MGIEALEEEIDNGIGPSKQTMDRSLAAKMYIEQYYTTLLQNARERGDRYVHFSTLPFLLSILAIRLLMIMHSESHTFCLTLDTTSNIMIHNLFSINRYQFLSNYIYSHVVSSSYYHCLTGHIRRLTLEKKMENMKLTNKEQSDLRKELDKKETEYMRFKRRKLTPTDFETIKIIGRGAFGEVFA